jgi:hypothetical protein
MNSITVVTERTPGSGSKSLNESSVTASDKKNFTTTPITVEP